MTVEGPNFSLATTLMSGQVFRWTPAAGDSGFIGWIGPDRVSLRQQGSRLFFQGTSADRIQRFFSLDLDYQKIIREIDVDEVIHIAIQAHRGLRVIRQDPWECLATFILSSFNNIPRLRGMLNRLSLRFGEPLEAETGGLTPDGVPLHLQFQKGSDPFWFSREARAGQRSDPKGLIPYRFPRPEALARASERALRNCGLGYRAPYLKAGSKAVATGKADLKRWEALDDEALRARLLMIPGVGEKVVECVMLFGFARASAFPVDVWIGRWMRARYFSRDAKVTDRQIRAFSYRHFGPYCGWAQQFLYCRARGVRPLGV